MVLGEQHLRVGLSLLLATDLQGPPVVLGGLLQPARGRTVPGMRVQTQTQEETGLLPQILWGDQDRKKGERSRGREGEVKGEKTEKSYNM